MKEAFGASELPRLSAEVNRDLKKSFDEKCRIEGVSMRFVLTALVKEWLALPTIPKKEVKLNAS